MRIFHLKIKDNNVPIIDIEVHYSELIEVRFVLGGFVTLFNRVGGKDRRDNLVVDFDRLIRIEEYFKDCNTPVHKVNVLAFVTSMVALIANNWNLSLVVTEENEEHEDHSG